MSLVISERLLTPLPGQGTNVPVQERLPALLPPGTGTAAWCRGLSSDPLAHVRLLLVHRILSARRSMLPKAPLSVHEEMVHAHELRGEAAHDHEHV
jgi:hypothetical protein